MVHSQPDFQLLKKFALPNLSSDLIIHSLAPPLTIYIVYDGYELMQRILGSQVHAIERASLITALPTPSPVSDINSEPADMNIEHEILKVETLCLNLVGRQTYSSC